MAHPAVLAADNFLVPNGTFIFAFLTILYFGFAVEEEH